MPAPRSRPPARRTAASLIARAQLRRRARAREILEHLWWRRWTEQSRSPRASDVAVLVGEQLDFDVARPLDVTLEIDRVVAERGLRLAPSGLHRLVELSVRAHDAHAATASAGGRLHDQRWLVGLRIVGTPASAAMRFAASLSPPARSASGGGPIHVIPAACTASAKSPFSARNP